MSSNEVELRFAAEISQLISGFRDAVSGFNATVSQMRSTAESGSQEVDDAFSRIGVRSLSDINEEARKVRENFRALEQEGTASAKDLERAAEATARQLEELDQEAKALNPTFRILGELGVRSTKDIDREIQRLESDFRQLQRSGRATGSDLERAFAATQARIQRLRQEANRVSPAFEALSDLGIKSTREINDEVERLERQYRALADSGELSARDQARAYQVTQSRIRELRGETGLLNNALREGRNSLALFVASAVGVGAALVNSAQEAREFGRAVGEVNTLLPDPGQINELSESVRQLSREYGQSNVTSAKALYEVISSGAGTSTDAVMILAQANRLAAAGVTDVQTAVSALQPALNAYQAGVGEAARFSDILFTAVREGRTTIPALSSDLGQVAPLAAQAGIDFGQLLASIAALTKGGLSTSAAITQVRGIITALLKPTQEATRAAAELGVNFDTAALRSQGLDGFLAQLRERLGGNSDAMARLFTDTEGLQGALSLTTSAAADFEKALRATESAAGATDEAFERIRNTPDQDIARFRSAFDDLRTSFGDAVLQFTPVLNILTDLINRFNDLDPSVRTALATITSGIAVIGTLATGVRALLPLMSVLRTLWLAQAAGATATATASTAAGAGMTAAAGGAGLLRVALLGLPLVAVVAALGAVVTEVEKLREANNNWLEQTRQLGFEQASLVKRLQSMKEEAQAFADVTIESGDRLREFTQTDLLEYTTALEKGLDYWRANLVEARNFGTQADVSQATQRVRQLEQALLDTRAELSLIAQGARDAGVGIVEAFDTSAGAGTKNAEVLSRLFEQLGLDAQRAQTGISSEVSRIAEQIEYLAKTGDLNFEALARVFEEAVGRIKTPQELQRFQSVLENLRRQGILNDDQLKELGNTLQGLASRAEGSSTSLSRFFETLRVDAERAQGGVSRSVQQIADQFTALLEQGELTGGGILASFESFARQVKTPEELQLLNQVLRQIQASGMLSGAELQTLTDILKQVSAGAGVANQDLSQTGAQIENIGQKASQAAQSAGMSIQGAAGAAIQGFSQVGPAIGLASNATGQFAQLINGALNGVRELSEGASEAVDRLIREQFNPKLYGDVATALKDINAELGKVRDSYNEQAAAADAAIARVEATGRAQSGLSQAVLLTSQQYQLLDRQRLDRLTSIIRQARQEQEALNAAARQGTQALEDELLSLQGREEDLIRSRINRRRNDLELQLQEARAKGAREAQIELERQLKLLAQIESKQLEQFRQSQRAQESRSASDSGAASNQGGAGTRRGGFSTGPAATTPPPGSSGTATGQGGAAIVVQFNVPGGPPVFGTFQNQQSALAVLDALRQAQGTTSV